MSDIQSIGVIGAGVMGGGIAQSCAVGGYRVVCTDVARDALERGKQEAASGRVGLGDGERASTGRPTSPRRPRAIS